jgi:hypothetical protein
MENPMTSPKLSKLPLVVMAVLLCGLTTAFPRGAADPSGLLGMWEGESKCTVPDSPCHDEHVLYRIAADKQDLTRVNIDAYKIVKGEQQFMGTIECKVPQPTTLSCVINKGRKSDWEFQQSGDTMSGTLSVDESKTLYRRVSVRRTTTKLQAPANNGKQ